MLKMDLRTLFVTDYRVSRLFKIVPNCFGTHHNQFEMDRTILTCQSQRKGAIHYECKIGRTNINKL